MIKVVKSIINEEMNLIGFILEGTLREFGGDSDVIGIVPVSIEKLKSIGYKGKDIKFENGRIREVGKFKISNLDMEIMLNGKRYPISNEIKVNKRFTKNNETAGYEIEFGNGTKKNCNIKTIEILTMVYKASNFRVCTNEYGLKYLSSSIAGFSLINDLPSEEVDTTEREKAKQEREKVNNYGKNASNELGITILDIYKIIEDLDGNIIFPKNGEYIGNASNSWELDKEAGFRPLPVGEIASGKLSFNPSNLNVNINFKKVGTIENVKIDEKSIVVYTNKIKSVFNCGKNKLDKMQVIVYKNKENELVNALSNRVEINRVCDENTLKWISWILNNNEIVAYEINTKDLDMIKATDIGLLSSSELVAMCIDIYNEKIISKFVGPRSGIMKELKNTIGEDVINELKGRKPIGLYSNYSEEDLNRLKDIGVDIYTGAFYQKAVTGKNASTYIKEPEISIKYNLLGSNMDSIYDDAKVSAVEATKMLDSIYKGKYPIPDGLFEANKRIKQCGNLRDTLKEATSIYYASQYKLDAINKKLWTNNATMYMLGNGKLDTRNNWKYAPLKSSAAKTVFEHVDNERLQMIIQNITTV